MFSSVDRAILGGEKDKWWIWLGFQDPRTAQMPVKPWKSQQASSQRLVSNLTKKTIKQAKNAKRTNGSIFTRLRAGRVVVFPWSWWGNSALVPWFSWPLRLYWKLVKPSSGLGPIGPNVPQNTEIPREDFQENWPLTIFQKRYFAESTFS